MIIKYTSTTEIDSKSTPDNPESLDSDDLEYRNQDPATGSHSAECPIGRIIDDGSSPPHVPTNGLYQRLFMMARSSPQSNLVVGSCAPRFTRPITMSTRATGRRQTENQAKHVRLKVAKVQLGVWYRQPDALPDQGRSFSIEYERDFPRNGVAYIHIVYELGLFRINTMKQRGEEIWYFISVKFSSIRNLGVGYDEFGQPFILFDLHIPPSFEVQRTDNRAPDGTEHHWAYKTYDRLSALDDAHARVAPYAYHMRVLLSNRDDLSKFKYLCHIARGNVRPVPVSGMDAFPRGLFSKRYIRDVYCWIKTMDWKNAFQIEAYIRCGLLNTHDLLFSLQKQIESVVRDYGDNASQLLRLFSIALRMRNVGETPSACLTRVRTKHPVQAIKPLETPHGRFLCHHITITPTRILLEGPYTTQSNRVIRHYQNHDPTLVNHFVRVEFREEDNLAYLWDSDVDESWFLRHRVGGILHDGFELGGRAFEFLASITTLHEHAAWFVAPFRDPVEGYVNAEIIRASLGDFSHLGRMPSMYAARIAQALTATEPSVKIRRDQWEEQEDLGPHTNGVGTISPELANLIWEENFCSISNLAENRVKPSAYQFRFLGYEGIVVVDHRLEGIKLRLRRSQRKFPVHDDEVAEFEIVKSFDHPELAHLNRPTIMALEDLGIQAGALIDIQDSVKARISSAGHSLEDITGLLKTYSIGGSFHLAFVLDQLTKLGLGPRNTFDKMAFGNAFLGRLLRDSAHHMLRELKYKTQMPVSRSYQLVGVADEGQAYIREGVDPDTVFTLKEGFIYVCVKEAADKEPVYFEGPCVICRNPGPAIHPGDVQRVYAVGMPPENKICFFRDLMNVAVLPAVGSRSLASCLGGGDMDGDTYNIYFGNAMLLPTIRAAPANYPPSEVRMLDEGRGDVTIDDVRDFVVEFMISDSAGSLADRHIVTADQSMDGIFDERCITLARLYRIALDYPTNGLPVVVDNEVPKTFIKAKPDWHRPEAPNSRHVDYYKSRRALGHLFRSIDIHEVLDGISIASPGETDPLEDVISRTLGPLVQSVLDTLIGRIQIRNVRTDSTEDLYARYASEMRFICVTHSVSTLSDTWLREEEVVLGTILAKCSQPCWREDRSRRMRMHTETLVNYLRARIIGVHSPPTVEELSDGLRTAWAVWSWAQHNGEEPFIQSFSLVALGLILELLELFGALPDS